MKKAFTLAEVLITLGIIGVVAALTLPTLIQNHQKQTWVNQLKKVVNTLENAAQMAVAEEGVSSFKDTNAYSRLRNMYDCNLNCSDTLNDLVKYLNLKYVTMDTSNKSYASNYKGSTGIHGVQGFFYPVVTPDSSIIYFSGGTLIVDVNGNKGPNELGRDTFELYFSLWDDTAGTIKEDYLGCLNMNPANYLQEGCYYTKIVSDGWKMNY